MSEIIGAYLGITIMLSVIYWKLISIDSNLKKIHTELVLQRTGGVSFDLPRRGR